MVVFIILLVLVMIRLFCLERSLKRLRKEWEQCASTNTNRLLPLVSSDRSIAELTKVLNATLRSLKDKDIELNKRTKQMEQEMADLAHDFRTPLTAALGYTQLFWQEGSYEQKEEDVRRIENRLQVLKSLSEELFEQAWLKDQEKVLELTQISLKNMVEETILGMASLWIEKGIDPDLDLLEGTVLANRQGIGRVLENLLSNALKYTEGTVRIEMPEPNILVIENEINDPKVEKILLKERYSTVCFENDSHGLGLMIAKGYMEKMNGSLTFEIKEKTLKMICGFDHKFDG